MIHQNPTVSNDDQPTIAIVTVNYYEKLAVDAMMNNKVTFVRHKPEGRLNRSPIETSPFEWLQFHLLLTDPKTIYLSMCIWKGLGKVFWK